MTSVAFTFDIIFLPDSRLQSAGYANLLAFGAYSANVQAA